MLHKRAINGNSREHIKLQFLRKLLLRMVGRAGLLAAECSTAEALARHLLRLAAVGKPPIAVRDTISAVRMAEKLLRPMISLVHSAIAAGAGTEYGGGPRQKQWGSLAMLRTMSAAVQLETGFAVLALAIFNVCRCLPVGETPG